LANVPAARIDSRNMPPDATGGGGGEGHRMKQARAFLRRIIGLLIVMALGTTASAVQAGPSRYPWRGDAALSAGVADRVSLPVAFRRIAADPGSFGEWLRGLPLKPADTPVRLYDGRPKWNQDNHVAVIDIDTGKRDLQQCADAVMRLRAEYLLGSGRARDIAFNDTDGKRRPFRGSAGDYPGFRRYMDGVFAYAGSNSLEREMRPMPVAEMRIGDVFIKGGFPGHAVLVIDMAESEATGEKRFLLMQSYMPAQDMHVLKNPKSADGTPWYAMPADDQELITPEWVFPPRTLRRFKE
jgi:Domain of unknown function (4846)